jgi:hypothetical protein
MSRPLPPLPLEFDSSFQPTSVVSAHDPQTLLYDLPILPSTTSMTSPTSPRSARQIVSPESPSFSGRSQRLRNGRQTPPPSRPIGATTPLGVTPDELEQFIEDCRSWYYGRDGNSGRNMARALATLPPSQRAPFARLQASIRSGYHCSINARRHAEFQAQLGATSPGGSLTPHARANPRGSAAQKERHKRMSRFISDWCGMGMPSTKPFFEALWAVMRLQLISEERGGAGRNRIEWEFDDAVFKEAAGKDFMLEAIDFLKGVLGFEEASSPKNPPSVYYGHGTGSGLLPQTRSIPPSTDSNTESLLATSIEVDDPPSPIASYRDSPISITQDDISTYYDDEDEQYLRVWTSPDLTNPEILRLVKLFPPFISRRPFPRFPVPNNSSGQVDIEEGDDDGVEGRHIHFGTGSMCVSSKQRTDAWEGGCCTRFVMWWKRIFC